MKARVLSFLLLFLLVGFPAWVHAQDGDDDDLFDTELLEGVVEDPALDEPQGSEAQGTEPQNTEPQSTEPQATEPQGTEGDAADTAAAAQQQEEEEDPLENPWLSLGDQDQEEEPLDRGQDQEQESEPQDQENEGLPQDVVTQTDEVGEMGNELVAELDQMEEMDEAQQAEFVADQEQEAEDEFERTRNTEGFTAVVDESGLGRGVPLVDVPSHGDTGEEDSTSNADDGGKGMHTFWQNLLGSVLQGVTDGFQKRYAMAKLNQMKARADRAAIGANQGSRALVDRTVRRNVRASNLSRLTTAPDPRLASLIFGNNRNGPLRATSPTQVTGSNPGQGNPITKYKLPTRTNLTGGPMMRSDGRTPIKIVGLPLGSKPITTLRRGR